MSTPAFHARPAGRFYHPELDVLRLFGFLMIFVHHSMPHLPEFYTKLGVPQWAAEAISSVAASGAFGVELFFMLSAYLVTELMIRERLAKGTVNLGDFYIRRALRLWPLYLFILGVAWGMQWWLPGQHIGWKALVAFLLMCGNWWTVFVGFPSSVIFPLWAVSVEEQFYLVWPWLLRRLKTRGVLWSVPVLLAMATCARWYLAARHTWESRIWCNTFAQLDAMALGILLAVVLGGTAPRIARWHRWALVVMGYGCLLLAASYFRIKADPLTASRVLLGYPVAAVGAMAILLGVLRPNEGNKPSLIFPVLAYLGRISYGLYVFHICGLMFSDYHVPHQDSSLGRYLFRNAVALSVTVMLAIASYHLLEMPFLKLKKRFTHVESGRAA